MQRPPSAHFLPPQHQQMFLPDVLQQQQHTQPASMPTPTSNWNMESMPWKIRKADHTGDVMEFTAHAQQRALLHQKRKSDIISPPLPVKQFISEEKITAHFNGLHISSDYIQHDAGSNVSSDELPSTSGKCFSNLTYEDYQMTAKELERKLLNANRITVCDELMKIQEKQHTVSYLPEALLNRIDKPCTALVLWQPPPPIINMFKQNMHNPSSSNAARTKVNNDEIIDDDIRDVDLPPEREDDEDIDDFVDNNNTCNLDLNNIKPMDEDM